MSLPCRLTLMLITGVSLSGAVRAAGDPALCAAIADNTERLACYDTAVNRPHQEAPPRPGAEETPFSTRWELDAEDKRGSFLIKPYKPTYILLGRITNSANRQPSSPGPDRSVGELLDVSPLEAKYQISFKTKLWEGLFGRHGDLWMGYTQQSSWQVYNKSNSSPFRETNYEPELMAVFRTNLDVGAGFKLKMMSLGFNHQSNGRAEPLSRSWNRLMGQIGIERDDFALLIRPWYRFSEKPGKDDNPDIGRYLGHGDLQAMWRFGEYGLGLNLRGPLWQSGGRGSAQLDWSFPIHRNLKGFVQVFSGYGETLIDYNHRQTTLGMGVSLVDWL
ncbi:phospholipase A [Zoogloea sp.]|uniref:phospholipase A n=1 Tax=Zoogloea sp. TaxID=49181 RepID=UPI002632CAD8|nr:phospholipase A [Zoogloea sp.]MDD3352382.1 phospholipase A [Zoogloea sp.]